MRDQYKKWRNKNECRDSSRRDRYPSEHASLGDGKSRTDYRTREREYRSRDDIAAKNIVRGICLMGEANCDVQSRSGNCESKRQRPQNLTTKDQWCSGKWN